MFEEQWELTSKQLAVSNKDAMLKSPDRTKDERKRLRDETSTSTNTTPNRRSLARKNTNGAASPKVSRLARTPTNSASPKRRDLKRQNTGDSAKSGASRGGRAPKLKLGKQARKKNEDEKKAAKAITDKLREIQIQRDVLKPTQADIAVITDSVANNPEWKEWATDSRPYEDFKDAVKKYEGERNKFPFVNQWLMEEPAELKTKFTSQQLIEEYEKIATALLPKGKAVAKHCKILLGMNRSRTAALLDGGAPTRKKQKRAADEPQQA